MGSSNIASQDWKLDNRTAHAAVHTTKVILYKLCRELSLLVAATLSLIFLMIMELEIVCITAKP